MWLDLEYISGDMATWQNYFEPHHAYNHHAYKTKKHEMTKASNFLILLIFRMTKPSRIIVRWQNLVVF